MIISYLLTIGLFYFLYLLSRFVRVLWSINDSIQLYIKTNGIIATQIEGLVKNTEYITKILTEATAEEVVEEGEFAIIKKKIKIEEEL